MIWESHHCFHFGNAADATIAPIVIIIFNVKKNLCNAIIRCIWVTSFQWMFGVKMKNFRFMELRKFVFFIWFHCFGASKMIDCSLSLLLPLPKPHRRLNQNRISKQFCVFLLPIKYFPYHTNEQRWENYVVFFSLLYINNFQTITTAYNCMRVYIRFIYKHEKEKKNEKKKEILCLEIQECVLETSLWIVSINWIISF